LSPGLRLHAGTWR